MINLNGINGIVAIAVPVIIGAVWLGSLQGTVNTLNPEVIRKEKEKAIEEIRKAGVDAKNFNSNVPVKEIDSGLIVRLEKIEKNYSELGIRFSSLVGENNEIQNKNKASETFDARSLDKRVSVLEKDIDQVTKKYDGIKGKIDGLSSLGNSSNVNVPTNHRPCSKEDFKKETKLFFAAVESFSQNGKTVSISISVKNKTEKDIDVWIFREYAILTSPAGETQSKSDNRFTVNIPAGSQESFSYSFVFKNDFEGDAFDFILKFENPASSFAFFRITNGCFQSS